MSTEMRSLARELEDMAFNELKTGLYRTSPDLEAKAFMPFWVLSVARELPASTMRVRFRYVNGDGNIDGRWIPWSSFKTVLRIYTWVEE